MLAPPKRFVAFNIVVDINCEVSACVFRCGPLLSAGTASLKPVPASSSNASEYASSAQGNKEVYSSSPHSAGSSDTCFSRRSQRSSAPNNHLNSENELYSIVAKHHVSEGNTRRLQRESEDDETRPLRVRRLIASPRKA